LFAKITHAAATMDDVQRGNRIFYEAGTLKKTDLKPARLLYGARIS
jgi:hypothetical protein